MHEKGIFHRDIKPENILIESSYDVWTGLKLADFGSCRGIYSRQPFTEYISTRWYRAPECLLTDGYYGPEMDVWGVGCVFYELSCLAPLFAGENEKDQMRKIHGVLGTPDDEVSGAGASLPRPRVLDPLKSLHGRAPPRPTPRRRSPSSRSTRPSTWTSTSLRSGAAA